MTNDSQVAANAAVDMALAGRPITPNNLSTGLKAIIGILTAAITANTTVLALLAYTVPGASNYGFLRPSAISAGSITSAMFAPGAVSGTSVIVVPIRTATGATDTTTSSDFVVCLNGPTQETLEQSPAVGTTHVIKDCRSGTGNAPIQVVTQGTDKIDGSTYVTLANFRQAMTVSYSTLGWQVY